jgi:hypothetical protein
MRSPTASGVLRPLRSIRPFVLRSPRPPTTTPTLATAAPVLRARHGKHAAEQRLDCGAHLLLHQLANHRQQALLSRHRVLLCGGRYTNSRSPAKAVRQTSQLQEKHAGGQAGSTRCLSPPPLTASSIIFPFIIPTGTNDGAIRGVGDAHAVVTTTSDHIDNQHVSNRDHLTTTISTTTSTATATNSTSRETMASAAVLLARPRRAGDVSGLRQLVEKPGCVRLRHGEQCCEERGIGHRLHGQSVMARTASWAGARVGTAGS